MTKVAGFPFSSSVLATPETPPKFAALSVPALPLRNGLPRGGITEIAGLRSSGRTAAVLHILAQATARGEICAVVGDSSRKGILRTLRIVSEFRAHEAAVTDWLF
jgi:RecA/RadA recombinase